MAKLMDLLFHILKKMKKLTIKDFILYNNPCINCGNNISFQICCVKKCDPNSITAINYLSPIINGTLLEISPLIRYNKRINLKIDCKTNKFEVSSIALLKKYLTDYDLFLESACNFCHSKIWSNNLKFNIDVDNKFVYPTEIYYEYLKINDVNNNYVLTSSFDSKKTTISVSKKDDKQSRFNITVAFMPLVKFKDKTDLLNKLRMYVLFS